MQFKWAGINVNFIGGLGTGIRERAASFVNWTIQIHSRQAELLRCLIPEFYWNDSNMNWIHCIWGTEFTKPLKLTLQIEKKTTLMSRKCYFKYETFDKIGVDCCNIVFRELDMFCLCIVFFITVMNKDKKESACRMRFINRWTLLGKAPQNNTILIWWCFN